MAEKPLSRTLDERIAATASRLTPSETTVARYFAEHREEVAFFSAADVAAALGLSDATVIRATQALGYRGLPELRAEVREAVRWRSNPAVRYSRALDALGDDAGGLLEHAISAQIEILEDAKRSLQSAEFSRALELLDAANRIVVTGWGPAAFVVDYFVVTLRRIGRSSLALPGRGVSLLDNLVELRAGDVMVVLAYEQLVREIDVALREAAERDVASILITDNLALALEGRYAVALSASRGGSDAIPSLTVPVVVLEALIFGLIGKDRPRSLAAMERLGRLRDEILPP